MPLPLKPGYHFNYDHTSREPHYEMATAEAYTDFYGISFMMSGDRMIYAQDFATIIKKGELSFIPKNVYRRTTYISNEHYERIIIKFTDSMVEDLIRVIGQDKFDELFKEHILRFDEDTQAEILAIFMEMEKEWNSYNQYSELLLKGLLHKLIILCVRKRLIGGSHLANLEKKNDWLANAIQYIKVNLKSSPSLKETAYATNISPSYLSKLFAVHLHTSYSDFILNEKITYARKLLIDSKLSMTEIAEESGFSSNAYFSDCFKRIMGITPLQYRKDNS